MTKEEYNAIFETALENAAQNTEKAFKVDVPRQFWVELVGAGKSYRVILSTQVVDELFIDENQFWLMINVMVIEVSQETERTTISMNVTGHGPGRFEETFNYTNGTGPFHQVLPMSLKISRFIPLGKVPDDFIP